MEQSLLWGTNRLYGTEPFDVELTDCMEQGLLWGTNRLYGTEPFDGELTDYGTEPFMGN